MRIDISKNLDQIKLSDPVAKYIHPAMNVLRVTMAVEEAIESLWQRPYNPHMGFFYVVDHNHILCGVISSHKLLHGKKEAKISELMDQNIVKLKDKYSVAEALLTLAEEHLMVIPVVNENEVLLGILEISNEIDPDKFDDITHLRMSKKATKDLYQVIGLSLEQHRKGVFCEYSARMPWLVGNIIAGLICAGIMLLYRDAIERTFILAMFIPLVLTLCESIAMQAAINTSHYLRHSKIPWAILVKRGWMEITLAVLIAATTAALTGAVSLTIQNEFLPMMVISGSIFVSMILASILGMMTTILTHKCTFDPKFASGPIVLMVTDITATATYFTLAYWLLP